MMLVQILMTVLSVCTLIYFMRLFSHGRYFKAFFVLAVVLSVMVIAQNARADDKAAPSIALKPPSFPTWTTDKSNVVTMPAIKPGNLTFMGTGNMPLIVFKTDGTVWANPNLKPDDTAKQVLDIIKRQFPTLCQANAGPVDAHPSQGTVK